MTLTEEILDNIDAYRMESLVAEGEVIKAHMEACMRDIQIQEEYSELGIIMESDKWDGNIIPKRDGENILKYIFFFIPRLIINFCRKIKEWWSNRKAAAESKAVAEMDEKSMSKVAQYAGQICAKINSSIKGGGHLEYNGHGFSYMTRIKRPASVLDTYKMFEERFTRYKDVVKTFIEQTSGGGALNPTDTNNYLITELESGSPAITDLCAEDHTIPISEEGYVENFPKIKKNVIQFSNNTIKAMQEVENMYKLVLAHPNMSGDNKILATRYMKLVEKIYNVFVRFENVVNEDLHNANNAFKNKNAMILKLRKKILEDQETPTAREDMEEKLDKWGVK